jgi:hypothetical protein
VPNIRLRSCAPPRLWYPPTHCTAGAGATAGAIVLSSHPSNLGAVQRGVCVLPGPDTSSAHPHPHTGLKHTLKAPDQGLWLTVALNSQQILLLFFLRQVVEIELQLQGKDWKILWEAHPRILESWRMQMAQLQKHWEPSSREIDPSCKIIRLLIAPAHSYKPWIQACFHHFPSGLCVPLLPGGQWLMLACLQRTKGLLAGWRETEPAHEFWTEDKSQEGLVSSSSSTQSQGSLVRVCLRGCLGATCLRVPFVERQLTLLPCVSGLNIW